PGLTSRAEARDPWLARVREAVAHEAASYGAAYPEGQGAGLRYTAFDRHAAVARQTLARLREAQAALARVRTSLKPLESREERLGAFRAAGDAVPWGEAKATLHAEVDLPALPAYSDYVD